MKRLMKKPVERRSKKPQPTEGELLKKYKRKYHAVLCILVAFTALVALYLYLNYDYLAFKHFITSSYIYTDTLDEVYKKELGIDTNGRYFNRFDNLAIAIVTRRIREEKGDRYTYLYTPSALRETRREEKEEASLSEITMLNDRTVYLKLTNFSKYTLQFMEKNMDKLESRSNIIIDLRDNRGGDIAVMADISGMFLPKKSLIATDRLRWMEQVYRSRRDQPLKYDKIIILQNNNTASASENMIAALNDNLDNVELIGTRTFGKGIGQYTLPLRHGYAVKATILEWYTPKGVNIHGNGIEPDIEYEGEDILQFAIDRII
ncbi:MAG: S41 family peptidase [Bacillota bacterium]